MPAKPAEDPLDRTLVEPGATIQFPLQEPTPFLVVIYPRELIRRFALSRSKQVIGRGLEADITLADELISRRHAEIVWDGSQVIVYDLQSTNGTFVDGATVEQATLGPDSRLQLGKVICKVEYKDSAELRYDKELFEAATTDPLTKIPNRRFFLERAHAVWSAAKRSDSWLHLILLDIDFFKKVNDTWGHPAGDFVLKETAAIFQQVKREEDLLARYGGEEFILLVSGINARQAEAFAERLRKAVEAHRFAWEDSPIPVTISLGLCSLQGEKATSIDSMIALADGALYQAKRAGRNRVCLA